MVLVHRGQIQMVLMGKIQYLAHSLLKAVVVEEDTVLIQRDLVRAIQEVPAEAVELDVLLHYQAVVQLNLHSQEIQVHTDLEIQEVQEALMLEAVPVAAAVVPAVAVQTQVQDKEAQAATAVPVNHIQFQAQLLTMLVVAAAEVNHPQVGQVAKVVAEMVHHNRVQDKLVQPIEAAVAEAEMAPTQVLQVDKVMPAVKVWLLYRTKYY